MKNILHILFIRPQQEQPDWSKLLELIGEIPPVYRAFCNCYIPESYTSEDTIPYKRYINEASMIDYFAEYLAIFDGDIIDVLYLYDLNMVVNQMEALNSSDDEIDNQLLKGVIPIGITHDNAYLLLGIASHNRDVVYLQNIGRENVRLANDILAFCRNINVLPTTYRIPDLNVLYRNWNEDFWRIRGEE